jgi:SAM-dependent MidA family methyltransferase
MHLKQLGGVTSFRQFMDLALNDPNDGFYGSGRARVARDGDFVTSPSLGPDFAGLLAIQVARWLSALPEEIPTLSLIEIGPGAGDLLADLVDALEEQSAQMLHRLELVLVEANPGMKQQQHERLQHQTKIPMRWCSLDELLAAPLRGLVIAHELLDALPVERLTYDDGLMWQQLVELDDDDALVFSKGPLPPELADEIERVCERCGLVLPPPDAEPGWTTEWHSGSWSWFTQLSQALDQGVLLVVDYALEMHRYYSARRSDGTLMAVQAQRAGLSPLDKPGSQDLTAHICIEIVEDAAVQAGWTSLGQLRQGEALLALGLAERLYDLQSLPPGELPQALQRREAMLRLVDPSGLGDFRWLLFGKGVNPASFKLPTAPDSA